jgi:hypothetical protein
MKKPMFIRVCANLLIGAGMFFAANAFADAKWSCSYRERDNTYVLTSLTAGDGGTASVYYVKDGALSRSTVGTETVIDLREEAMPEGAPKILSIGHQMWMKNTVVQEIYMPNTVRILGSRLIESATNLVHIEPFVPESVTNVAAGVFQWGSVTNDFRVGFAKDENEDGKYLETELLGQVFWGTYNVPSIVFGPGIKKIPANFTYGASSVASIEFGENIEEVGDSFTAFKGKLTNIVFKTKGVFPFPSGTSMFNGCTLVQEVTWNGWCEHPATTNPFNGWKELQCRFIIPGDNLKWAVFCANTNNVTPWKDCTEDDKTAYRTKYGENAKEPVGISVANSASFPRTYIVTDGKTLEGAIVDVTAPNAAFGTLTMTTPQNTDGTYTSGSTVTITWTKAEGVEFTGWTGDVAEDDKMKETIEVTAENVKSVKPTFKASFWAYGGGELTDGEWVLAASGAADSISAGKVKSYVTIDGTLDLRKGVKGGVITAIADNAYNQYANGKCVKEILLPDTLTTIGGTAFRTWRDTDVHRSRIWPLVPTNVTSIAGSAFYMEPYMLGSIAIGFATNAAGESVETVLNEGGNQFRTCVGLGPTVEIGPGVRSIPTLAFYETCKNYASPVEVWIGSGVTNAAARAFSYFHYAGNGKAVTTKATTYHIECDMFPGSSAMFYNGTTAEITDYTARFRIEGEENREWLKYVWNGDYVTKWADLTDDQKQQYWTTFPEETFGTEHPMGLVKAAQDTTGLPPNQWVFAPRAGGLVIRVQ